MGRKKKLKEKDFLKILKTNSKENPFDIDNYNRQSIVDCRIENLDNNRHFYIKFTCINCDKSVIKDMIFIERSTIEYVNFCKQCKWVNYLKTNYGVTHNSQLDSVKKKKVQTCLEHYGVEHPLQSKKILNKAKKTMKKRYGTEYSSKSEEIKEKIANTNMERYGNRCSLHGSNQKKTEQAFIDKYGVDNPRKSSEIINKMLDTKFERYGSVNLFHLYKYNEINFDSSWELAFYIYHVDRNHNIKHEPTFFTYKYNNVLCRYYPDFKINGKYYEIKGEQFIKRNSNGKIVDLVYFGESNKKSSAKYKCMKKHNVTIIDGYKIQKYLEYVINKYGEDYLDQFRIE